MPAPSKSMRRAAAIALHSPGKLYEKNKSLKQMSKEQLKEYAETPEKRLPKHTPTEKSKHSGEGVFGGGKSRKA